MTNSAERSEIWKRLQQAKIPLLIMTVALVVLLFTGRESTEKASTSFDDHQAKPVTIAEEESRLAETLQVIEGVGNARVLLSVRKSAQTDYLSDEERTVILSAGSGRQVPIVLRTTSPEYLGAVIVCDGGDDPDIQWKVLEAVSRFTGLRSDQITVLKLRT